MVGCHVIDREEEASRCHRFLMLRHQPPAAGIQVVLFLLLRRLRFALSAHRRLFQADRNERDAGWAPARLPTVRRVRQRPVLGHRGRAVQTRQRGDAGLAVLLGGLHAGARLRATDAQLMHQSQHDARTPVTALARPLEALGRVIKHGGRLRQNQEIFGTGTR